MQEADYRPGLIGERPWGQWQVLDIQEGFVVKKILVHPNCRLSLQRHQHRAEHWLVATGVATVEVDGEICELRQDDFVKIPQGSWHRLSNNHEQDLYIIELQMGSYLSESDIERAQDDYGR